MRKIIVRAALIFGGVLLAAGLFWSGLYNIGADDEHWPPVYAALDILRERSIAVRANKLDVPPLDDPALIRSGAGNYAAMCQGCHRAPGLAASELSLGLYPQPPQLADPARKPEAAHDFWAIKHGIKASGMPAWGRSMKDPYLWGMVAFLQKLPTLSAQQYQELVESSEGHSHGGGEDHDSDHDHEDHDHHDETGVGSHLHDGHSHSH